MSDETKWSEFQNDLFSELTDGDGSVLVQALAGSGKTTTAIEASKRLDPSAKVSFAAFNKSIQLELEKKLPRNVKAKTFHSWGLASLRKSRFSTTVEKDKTKILMEEVGCPRWQVYKYGGLIRRMVGTAKNLAMNPGLDVSFSIEANSLTSWKRMLDRYSMLELYQELQDNDEKIEEMISIAQEVLKIGSEPNTPIIDFDDMLYMPVIHGLGFERNDVLFVDEAQDVSAIQTEIIKRSVGNTGRVVAIGDQYQSIYAWRGAGMGSMDEIAREFNATELSLPICYRCGEEIIKKAQRFVPQLIWHPPTGKGEIVDWGDEYNFDDFVNGDFVLCRNKAPLVDLAFKLKKRGGRVSIIGKDIGQQVINFIKSMKANNFNELKHKLNDWWEAKKKYFKKIGAVQGDAVDNFKTALKFITYSESGDINTMVREIESFFTDKRNVYGVTLSTIHKAKGLEAERVFILNPDLMPSKYAKQEWEKEQEDNLHYVGITRAQKSLNYIEYKSTDSISTRIDGELSDLQKSIEESDKPKFSFSDAREVNKIKQAAQGG